MINTQKLREALSQIEDALHDAYQNAGQECCGHGQGGECCGNPEPVWDAADQKIMDVLGPIQRTLSDVASQPDAQTAEIAGLKSYVEMLEACAAGDAALTAGQRLEIARLRDALLWAAGALQMACAVDVIMGEADGISINNETRTVAQILDAANAALSGESHD